ncbi:MAG: hypothetical protein ACRDA3_07950, partial [Peptostreptococcaceae bacterium]
MKVKKYINNKVYDNLDVYKISIINKYIQIDNVVIDNIVSVTVVSKLMDWNISCNKLCIEGNITYKILYTSKDDNRIFLIKDEHLFYNELELPDYIDGESIMSIKSRNGFEVGCNIQDVAILKDSVGYILIAATLINWINVIAIPRIVLYIQLDAENSYLYIADKKLKIIEQLTYDNDKKYESMLFSQNGYEVILISNIHKTKRLISKINICTGFKNEIFIGDSISNVQKFSDNSLIFEEKKNNSSDIKILNINNLKVTNFLIALKAEIVEIWCENNIVCIVVNENREKKLWLFNKEKERILTIIGEYRLPRIIKST